MRRFARSVGLGGISADALAVVLGQLAAYVYPLASIPLLSRVLGPSSFGQLIFEMAIIQISLILVEFGFELSALRKMSVTTSYDEQERIIGATITAKSMLFAGLVIILLTIVFTVPQMRERWLFYVIGLAMIAGHVALPSWLLQGLNMIKTLAVILGVSRLIALLGLLATVRDANDAPLAMAWQFAPYTIATILAWSWLYKIRAARIVFASLPEAISALRDSAPLFASKVSGAVIETASSIMLGVFSTGKQVAYFGTADRLANAGRGILGRVTDAMLPRLARAETGNRERTQRATILAIVGGSYVIAGLGVIITAHWLIPWFLGSEFYPSVPAARLLGVELCITGITAGLMLNLIAQKRYRPVSRVMIFGVIIHLGLLPPATALFGAVGAAATSAITEACIAFMLWMAVRSNEQRIPIDIPVRQVEQKSYPDSSKNL